jgi:hypothetical protein
MSLPLGESYLSSAQLAAREAARTQARATKAYNLTQAFRAELVKVAAWIDPDTKAGAEAVLQMAVAAPQHVWDSTAELHGIRTPSRDTVKVAIAILRSATKVADDPFAGLQ